MCVYKIKIFLYNDIVCIYVTLSPFHKNLDQTELLPKCHTICLKYTYLHRYIFIFNWGQLKLTFSRPWLFLITHLLIASFWERRWIESLPLCYLTYFPCRVGDSSHSFLLQACDRYFFEERGENFINIISWKAHSNPKSSV